MSRVEQTVLLAILREGFRDENLTVTTSWDDAASFDRSDPIVPYLTVTNKDGGMFSVYFTRDHTVVVRGQYPTEFHVDIRDPESIPDMIARLKLRM